MDSASKAQAQGSQQSDDPLAMIDSHKDSQMRETNQGVEESKDRSTNNPNHQSTNA